MAYLQVPAETLPVIEEADICVVGGSCTGLFAAVRAARLGAKVVLIEKQNRLGGLATLGMVSMWHPVYDIGGERQVIGGLTYEMMRRLERRNAIGNFHDYKQHVRLNSEELTLELDALALEHPNIRLYLHTAFSRVLLREPGVIDAIVVENYLGRFAIRAKQFIDASGDGLLAREAGCRLRLPERPQPPTSCARLANWNTIDAKQLSEMMDQYRHEFPDLPCGYWWGMHIPNSPLFMLAGTRVLNYRPEEQLALTRGELETRRQVRAILDMLKAKVPGCQVTLETLPATLGIRESWHIESLGQVKGEEMLAGTRFPDAIGNGTYPVDIHNDQDETISFRWLDGRYATLRHGKKVDEGRWLPEGETLPFYQFHLRSLIPAGMKNLITAGRMIDADREAFGALRVMVNLNQCGEAAGVAAYQALHTNCGIAEADPGAIRKRLVEGGSILP